MLAEKDLPDLMQELNFRNFTMDSTGAKVIVEEVTSGSIPSQTAINRAKENPNKNFLVIGDDLSTDPRYFTSLISSVGTVSIAGQHAV